ncbi:hypothetical protein [Oceanobacillus sp. FSL W7-1293]|uniref:hypothetical protein n=1 Tax=Oceanobacillus sp. FSL W7-1293 TaxID=2921699 RepID=UPI0030D56B5C
MFRCIYKKTQTTKSLAFVIIPLDGLNIVTEVFHASEEMIIPLPSYQAITAHIAIKQKHSPICNPIILLFNSLLSYF